MSLTVLSVGYPLAPVSLDTAGGAEQILALIDRALVRGRHNSLVIGRSDSRVEGELVPIPVIEGEYDENAKFKGQLAVRDALIATLANTAVDLVHLHGIDFISYLPAPGPPVLVTLHLPLLWYPAEIWQISRPRTYMHCVSDEQQELAIHLSGMLPPIPNGIDLSAFRPRYQTCRFALALGRICAEKGFHHAMDACTEANLPLVLAGQVFPYWEHIEYFDREIKPRLSVGLHRFIGPVGLVRKRRLLAAACCLIVSSTVQETSSLVAMEAAACGTPVVGFETPALKRLVQDGITGFLTSGLQEMVSVLPAVELLNRRDCRARAESYFSADRMCAQYLRLYTSLAESG